MNHFKTNDESIISFGKYKGRKMGNVPWEYLLDLYESGMTYGSIEQYIKDKIKSKK